MGGINVLDDKLKELFQGPNFGTIATLLDSGAPLSHPMWVDADDTHVILNTELHRVKFKNIERDPRVSVLVLDAGNPYRYGEVRGRVVEVVRGQRARDHIDELSMKYQGELYDPAAITSERVILKISPERQRPPS
jgi:PPOX class probable F420-dependent enzyme